MKKISLLDKMRLTDRFMDGQLSIVVDAAVDPDGKDSVERDGKYWKFSDGERVHCRFSEGDVLPVVMSYQRAGLDERVFGTSRGWNDKRCVNPKYMPHKMEVERVRCVRVQDLTEEEALKAGMKRNMGGLYMVGGGCGGCDEDWRKMFARMMDFQFRVPYAMNPWVVVYDMKPIIVARTLQDGEA